MNDMIPQEFPLPRYVEPATKAEVLKTLIKMDKHFREHDSILVSVSGGGRL